MRRWPRKDNEIITLDLVYLQLKKDVAHRISYNCKAFGAHRISYNCKAYTYLR